MSKKLLLLISIFTMFVLAACGGSEPEEPQISEYNYEFTSEFVFDPNSIVAKSGDTIKINLDNTASALEHSWILVPAGVDTNATEDEINPLAIRNANSGTIAAGEETSITFTAPEPGAYEFVCAVAGHLTGGMVGKFTVTE